MGRVTTTVCTLVVLVGGGAFAISRDDGGQSTPPVADQRLMAGLAEPGPIGESQPPRAVVRGCASRISGGSRPPDSDTIIGPLRLNMQCYSTLRAWRRQARSVGSG